jgi:hypothetical protein
VPAADEPAPYARLATPDPSLSRSIGRWCRVRCAGVARSLRRATETFARKHGQAVGDETDEFLGLVKGAIRESALFDPRAFLSSERRQVKGPRWLAWPLPSRPPLPHCGADEDPDPLVWRADGGSCCPAWPLRALSDVSGSLKA